MDGSTDAGIYDDGIADSRVLACRLAMFRGDRDFVASAMFQEMECLQREFWRLTFLDTVKRRESGRFVDFLQSRSMLVHMRCLRTTHDQQICGS